MLPVTDIDDLVLNNFLAALKTEYIKEKDYLNIFKTLHVAKKLINDNMKSKKKKLYKILFKHHFPTMSITRLFFPSVISIIKVLIQSRS